MFLAKKSHKITNNIRKRKKNENKLCKYRIFFCTFAVGNYRPIKKLRL